MGKKHDEIVRSLSKEKIIELFVPKLFGEQGGWGPYHLQVLRNKEVLELTLEEINAILKIFKEDSNEFGTEDAKKTLKKIKEEIQEEHKQISNLSLINSVKMIRKIEVPIIKGEGQYY